MLKASALYVVIIIAVIIAIFSAALISTGYFYRLEYQKNLRFNKLAANLSSGIALALSAKSSFSASPEQLDLYGESTDSLELSQEKWGLFNTASVKAFTQRDTLKKAFMIANLINDPAALHLSDEDRPLSVSGSTEITGEAVLPKAGIKQAYVDGRPYSGTKLVYGAIKISERTLPKLNEERLAVINSYLADTAVTKDEKTFQTLNSFFNSLVRIRYHRALNLNGTYSGKILIISDTLITIEKEASLQDVIIAAPAIVVKDGFKGSCQLYASDSVVIGKSCIFEYPSAAGVLKAQKSKIQCKVQLGANTSFSGMLFSYEKERSDLQTMVSLGKNTLVKGEVYACGYIKMEKPITILGKASCSRFIIQTPATLYENYLLDIRINRNKRSPHYLSSFLISAAKENKQILKWLE